MRGVNGLAGVCAGVIAALALGLAAAPVASAGTSAALVLKTAKGKVANGAPFVAVSSDAILATNGGGSVECEESQYAGTVLANAAKLDRLQINSALYGGDYNSILGACRFSGGGYAVTETVGLPWKLELIPKKGALIDAAAGIRVSFPETMPEVSCLYETNKQLASINIGGPLTLDFANTTASRKEGPEASCPGTATLTAKFTVTSEGEAVTASFGSSEESGEPGSVSGLVTNGKAEGVEGIALEACTEVEENEHEEEEPAVCRSGVSGVGGHYSITNLPSHFYTLTATPPAHSGYGLTHSEEFLVQPGEAVTEDVQLRGTGEVRGEVTTEGGAPLGGVPVEVCEQTAFGHCFTTTTESSGAYTVPEVATGTYRVTASPAGNSGYAKQSSGEFALGEAQTVITNLKLPEAGSVTGIVTNQRSEPVADAIVDACSLSSEACYQAKTDGLGSYTIEGVADEEYVASVAPETQYNGATSSHFLVVGTATKTVDLTVQEPVAPPAGTEIPGSQTTALANGVQVPLFFWNEEVTLKTTGCVDGHVSATVTGTNTQTFEVQTIGPVTLGETPASSGQFAGKLPKLFPIHGPLTFAVKVEGCAHPSEEATKEFNAYVDPSGVVVDGNHADAAISGATVTLLAGPDSFGPFTSVPNGSTVMSPANRRNSDTTSSLGQFGWDTLPGYYEVEAHKPGCGTTTTPSFRVPPPVDNLQLVLHCEPVLIETTSLPDARQEVHYETQLTAGGEDPPFKWKKKAALPKGLKLSKTGVLSGTMTSKKVKLGTYSVEVEVKDAAKHTATITLPLKVR